MVLQGIKILSYSRGKNGTDGEEGQTREMAVVEALGCSEQVMLGLQGKLWIYKSVAQVYSKHAGVPGH